MIVKFQGTDLLLEQAFYGNGRKALCLHEFDEEFGCYMDYMTASVNLVDEDLAEDEICIKDYSENTGILQALVEAGVVSNPIRMVSSGFVQIPVCKLYI